MRIVAGKFRGRVITPPDSKGTRPTSDKTRETLFNIVQHADWAPSLDGAKVMDLFAGSGALGFEALSRGADFALFIEMAPAARLSIKANVEQLRVQDSIESLKRDVTRLGAMPDTYAPGFDLILCDPPYRKGLADKALTRIADGHWLAEGGLVVMETAADEEINLSGWQTHATRKIGPAMLWFVGAL